MKYKDEFDDKVSQINLYHSYLNKKIRECLLKDLNAPINPYIHDIFYQSLPNKINFIEDIYHVPLLKNNFLFKNGFERIIEPNFINREYKLTLNKARREKIFIENEIRNNTYYKSIINNMTNEKEQSNNEMSENKIFQMQLEDYFVYSTIDYKGVKIIPHSELKQLIYNL
jgi:hypothetical protein